MIEKGYAVDGKCGIIPIDAALWRELLADVLSVDDADLQGTLRKNGVFQKVHDTLLLPYIYHITSIFFHWPTLTWHVMIESETLPEVHLGDEPTKLLPVYKTTEGGGVELVRIKKYTSKVTKSGWTELVEIEE